MLVRLVKQGDRLRARAPPARLRFRRRLWARRTIPNGRPSPSTKRPGRSWSRSARSASAGARRASGTWRRGTADGRETKLRLTLADGKDELADVAFPYFGNREHDHFTGTEHPSVLVRKVPAKRVEAEGRRGAGRHGVRPVRRQLRRRSRLRRRARRQVATTRTSPTRRPGPRRSAACRAIRSSQSRASSPATPRRPRAARWSSSARR